MFALIVAFATSMTMQVLHQKIWIEALLGSTVGLGVFFFFARFSKGKKVRDIAEVKEGQIEVKDHELIVDRIFISNLLGIRIIVHSFSTCRLESGIPKKTYV